MKKTLLSLVLCVAVLVSAVSAMVAMPASAADDINVLLGTLDNTGGDGTAVGTVNEDGSVTVTNTGAGEVGVNLGEGGISVLTNPAVEVSITSDVNFDISFYDANNNKWIRMAGDYYPAFNEQKAGSTADAIVAGTYTDVKFNLQGAYTWNPDGGDPLPVPENAAITGMYIIPKAAGSLTITKLLFTDGISDVSLNSRGDVSATEWDNSVNLLDNEYVNVPVDLGDGTVSNVKVTETDDGVVFGNDKAGYPCASYTFATPYLVNTGAALDMDFTVNTGAKTTIYLFLGPTTPDNFNTGEFITVVDPANILTLELGPGKYTGVYFLEDLITNTINNLDNKDNCYDEDGKIIIKGMKIYGTSDGAAAIDNAVTVRKMNLVYNEDSKPTVPTTAKGATTTTQGGVAPGAQTTGADGSTTAAGATTTVNKGDSNGGNSASTGDVSDAALFIVVAAAAAAVVTLSVVASKKAKSR